MRRSIKMGIPIPEEGADVDTWGRYLIECLEQLDLIGGEVIEARGTYDVLNNRIKTNENYISDIQNALNIASQIGDSNLLSTFYRILNYRKNCINEYLPNSGFTYANGVATLTGPVIFNTYYGTNFYLYKIPDGQSYNVEVPTTGIYTINLEISGAPSNPFIRLSKETLTEDFVPEPTEGKIRVGFIVDGQKHQIPANRELIINKTDQIVIDRPEKHGMWWTTTSFGFKPQSIDILIKVTSSQQGAPSVWIRPSSDVMVPIVTRHDISFSIFAKGTSPDYYVYKDSTYLYNIILEGVIVIK
jgi:hypothetical protein